MKGKSSSGQEYLNLLLTSYFTVMVCVFSPKFSNKIKTISLLTHIQHYAGHSSQCDGQVK